jgi:hypothetical protein
MSTTKELDAKIKAAHAKIECVLGLAIAPSLRARARPRAPFKKHEWRAPSPLTRFLLLLLILLPPQVRSQG